MRNRNVMFMSRFAVVMADLGQRVMLITEDEEVKIVRKSELSHV